jgi:hypothetical protein
LVLGTVVNMKKKDWITSNTFIYTIVLSLERSYSYWAVETLWD